MQAPQTIHVGIMAEKEISFVLNAPYSIGQSSISGKGKAILKEEMIELSMPNGESYTSKEILLSANGGSFTLEGVTIGVDFHWERKHQQTFEGNLILKIEGDKIRAINKLSIENYLCSVISSEMSATSSLELLKAHTITSRSWLLAQIIKSHQTKAEDYTSHIETKEERIKWYDREDHDTFDVCADDHCQRYQGITRIVSPLVKKAVEETAGQVLTYKSEICDARYYKACGGVTEHFENSWEPEEHPYLEAVVDMAHAPEGYDTDLSTEANAKRWIMNSPYTYCNVDDAEILKEVLNDFDQETPDFYRWKVEYTQEEISTLINERSGIDFGQIISLTPLARGKSGRINRLKIEGTKRTFIIGKELEIRRCLSSSHLYSSAFVVDYGKVIEGIPQNFTLYGAGWGHGVGLCQIGAAVMAHKGIKHKDILLHYFRGAKLQTI